MRVADVDKGPEEGALHIKLKLARRLSSLRYGRPCPTLAGDTVPDSAEPVTPEHGRQALIADSR
jgi:hypothetical protein